MKRATVEKEEKKHWFQHLQKLIKHPEHKKV